MKYAFISDYSNEFPVKLICKVLGVSSSGYYDWCGRDPSNREKRRIEIMILIDRIHQNSKDRYGAPRISHALFAQAIKITQSTVSRWMKEASISRKGNGWDNSPTESFFHSLKTELVYFENYQTREEAKNSLFEYMEVFYNRQRLHSSLNYKTPVDYEQSFVKCA